MLTKEEIQAIQGSAITDTKSSESAAGVFRVSQCYFAATEPDRSVSLSVTQANAGVKGKHSPRDYWNETFGRFGGGEKESESDKEKKESLREQREKGEEEKAIPPKKITGIGEDAYWVGNRVGGSLYVLKKDKDAFIRISVGGSDKEEGKIDKSKALAQKALDRL